MAGIVYDQYVVLNVTSNLVTGIANALIANGSPVGRSLVTEGEIVWDNCDCGQLALAIVRSFMSTSVTNEQRPLTNCQSSIFGVDAQIQYVRCVPNPDNSGNPPSALALTDSARLAEIDKFIIRDTALCLLNQYRNDTPATLYDFSVYEQLPLGASGGCGGSQLNVRLAWIDCFGC